MISNQSRVDLRRVAVALAGFTVFVNLYAPWVALGDPPVAGNH